MSEHTPLTEAVVQVLRECEDAPGWTCTQEDEDELLYECNCGDKSPVLAHGYIGATQVARAAEWHREHIAARVALRHNPNPRGELMKTPTEERVACRSCPISFRVPDFIDMVTRGWDQQHTFTNDDFNDGQVIVCRGRFSLRTVDLQ